MDHGPHLKTFQGNSDPLGIDGKFSTCFLMDISLHLSIQVSWRPVFWGIGLQFLLGLLILRTKPGFIAFDWLGKQVQVSLVQKHKDLALP